ncbi:MAG: DUF2812 domain-containing protein [Oscillospiraceae bacterium]|nr:DUF2812 domain-containing protein [Oscillospiraceae bacterium]
MKGKSDSIKRVRKFFSIAEFEKEEKYLTDMAAQGWRFVDTNGTIYTFERCEPENVVYRLDFSGIPLDQRDDYYAMFRDYGWEYLQDSYGFSYFRKPAEGAAPEDLEIFSDGASHLEMVKKIMLAKITPMILILISCITINYDKMLRVIRNDSPNKADWFSVIGVTLLVLTIAALFCRTLGEFLHLKKKYSKSA